MALPRAIARLIAARRCRSPAAGVTTVSDLTGAVPGPAAALVIVYAPNNAPSGDAAASATLSPGACTTTLAKPLSWRVADQTARRMASVSRAAPFSLWTETTTRASPFSSAAVRSHTVNVVTVTFLRVRGSDGAGLPRHRRESFGIHRENTVRTVRIR